MSERKLDHHFVPRLYLEGWSDAEKKVWVHRLLVPDDRVPPWRRRSVRGIAYHRHLYTRRVDGRDLDEMERWLDREFETPAGEPIRKLRSGRDLTEEDWRRIAAFVAAQDLRTPSSYLEMRERWSRDLPGLMNQVLERGVRDLKRGKLKERRPDAGLENPRGIFDVRIEHPEVPGDDQAIIHAEVTIGRALWLEGMKRLLTSTAGILERHHWSIAEPADDTEWFTSDHPVVKLNYHEEGRYDFKGGWGSAGTEILFPISPRLLLYTQIGEKRPRRFQFSRIQTLTIQRILAERAFRFVFAARKIRRVSWFRPRVVDRRVFLDEQEQWRRWNEDQGEVEG